MTPSEKDVRGAWTCDDRRLDGCRNPHGCHCAEIGSLLARAQSAEQERDRLAKAVEINHGAAIKASQEVVALQAERDRLRDLIARGYPAILARAETAEAALNEAGDVIGLERAALERLGLVEACRPFANWAADNVEADLSNVDFGVWSCNRTEGDRIKDWFGPTDFYRLTIALSAFTPAEEG